MTSSQQWVRDQVFNKNWKYTKFRDGLVPEKGKRSLCALQETGRSVEWDANAVCIFIPLLLIQLSKFSKNLQFRKNIGSIWLFPHHRCGNKTMLRWSEPQHCRAFRQLHTWALWMSMKAWTEIQLRNVPSVCINHGFLEQRRVILEDDSRSGDSRSVQRIVQNCAGLISGKAAGFSFCGLMLMLMLMQQRCMLESVCRLVHEQKVL